MVAAAADNGNPTTSEAEGANADSSVATVASRAEAGGPTSANLSVRDRGVPSSSAGVPSSGTVWAKPSGSSEAERQSDSGHALRRVDMIWGGILEADASACVVDLLYTWAAMGR